MTEIINQVAYPPVKPGAQLGAGADADDGGTVDVKESYLKENAWLAA